MGFLAFLLECAAVMALTGMAVSLAAGSVLLALRWPALHRVPVLRADAAFVLGAMPAVASLTLVSAAAAPSVMAALGWGRDHCATHGHHLHLCLLHSAGLRPVLAVLGAMALAVFLFRAGALVHRLVKMRTRLAALEALGTSRPGLFPVILLPGAPRLCHAAGALRRRILLSASMEEALPSQELQGALAHEVAHLRRRDPLVGLLLLAAGLFMPPFLARAFLSMWQLASEEACDAEAVERVGDSTLVASALVKMAALQRRASHEAGALAFGEVALERRVRLLLEAPARRTMASLALVAAMGAAFVTWVLALLHTSFLHHAVETALSLFS